MPGFDVHDIDFADEIRGEAPRARRWPLLAAVVLVVAALVCVGMAYGAPRREAAALASWVPAPQSTERGFASLEIGERRP